MSTPEAQQPPDIQVLTSNLCMPPAALFLGSTRTYQNHADIIGVDGYEVTPVYSRFVGEVANAAKVMEVGQTEADRNLEHYVVQEDLQIYGQLIKSGHGTFRDEVQLVQEPPLFRAFPGTQRGLDLLTAFRAATNRQLQHVVLYNRDQDQAADYRAYEDTFTDRSFQPKARDWVGLWGLYEDATDNEIAQKMFTHGFDSITWDVFHAQVTGKNGLAFEDPLGMAQRLSAYGWINAVHVALNRQDCTKGNPVLAKSTREAQEAFIESPEAALETLEGKMLWHIVQDWKRLSQHAGVPRFVVLEEMPTRTLRASQVQDRQAAIVDSIRGIIARAR